MEQQNRPTKQKSAAAARTPSGTRKTTRSTSARQTTSCTAPRKTNAAAGRTEAPKKKKQKVRFHNKNLKYQLLTVLAVVAAVVLCLVVFFRVNHINVQNNGNSAETEEQTEESTVHAYYTAQQIIDASGIEIGENLLTISKESVAAKIIAQLPYVSEVSIHRVLPGTVDLVITEYDVAYAIQDTDGGWWLINRNGTVMEQTDETEAKSHLCVSGLRITNPTVSAELTAETAEDTAEQEAKKTSLISILQEMETYDYCKQIVSLDLTSSYDICLWYGTQFEIKIGNTEELEYKLSYLEGVLKELKSYQSGEIDLTFAEDKTARFRPFSE